MSRNKSQLRIVTRYEQGKPAPAQPEHPTVSLRWLLSAIGITLLGALLCAWASLCLLFWQGAWQLLYHPSATVAPTPANAGLAYDAVAFAATDTGQLRLQGWWIPAQPGARFSRYTVLYLHGPNGNLGDAIDALAQVHAAGVNVFAARLTAAVNLRVGLLDGSQDRFRGRAIRQLVIDQRHRVGGKLAGQLASSVSTHAIGQDE